MYDWFVDNKLSIHFGEDKAKSIKLQNNLPKQSLLTIYKSFIRLHLDCGDVVYDQPHNETFCSKLESVQYNAALPITGAIRETS